MIHSPTKKLIVFSNHKIKTHTSVIFASKLIPWGANDDGDICDAEDDSDEDNVDDDDGDIDDGGDHGGDEEGIYLTHQCHVCINIDSRRVKLSSLKITRVQFLTVIAMH